MDVAGLSPERAARSAPARRTAPREGRARRLHASVVRPEPAAPRPAPAGATAGADAADQLQADYFIRLLSKNRRLIEQRIDDYRKAIASAQVAGDADTVCNLRRMARIEEQDRDTLDAMLENLRRRFARRAPGEPAALSARPRSAVQ